MGNYNDAWERGAHVTLTLLILFLSNQLLQLLSFVLHLSFPMVSLILTARIRKHMNEGHLTMLQSTSTTATVL